MDFTFLTKDQIFGANALDVIKRYGTPAQTTDLAAILGAYMDSTGRPDLEDERACLHWTADKRHDNSVLCISKTGGVDWCTANGRGPAVRPTLAPSEAAKIHPNKTWVAYDGIQTAEYGEYPQTVADKETSAKLESLFQSKSLRPTDKGYTFDAVKPTDFASNFKPAIYPEYELDGKRYIRVPGRPSDNDATLSTGEHVETGKPYWIEVEPIQWLVDETGTWVSKRCLFAGIQFDVQPTYDGDFSKTFMKHYLDTYFANEIGPRNRDLSRDSTAHKEPTKKKDPSARQKRYGIQVSEEPMPVKDQINFYIQNGMSFMLHGLSGIGKTRRVEEIDPDLTPLTLCNGILPEQIIGKTRDPEGVDANGEFHGVWQAPTWYTNLCQKCKAEPGKQHVLFIDEVTNVRETTQSMIFNLVLQRSIDHDVGKLPDNAVVVLAGNSKEESGAAYNMPAPLFRRLSHIYLDLNIPDWLEWGSERSKSHPEDPERMNIHPLIASFVATYGMSVFYSQYDEEDPEKFALDPRKWEMVSDKIYANKGVIRREILEADIGLELTESLLSYAKNPPLSLDEVMEDEYTDADIPKGQDARLALALSLRHATPKQVEKVRQFVETQLGAENRAIFDSVWAGKDDTRALQIANPRIEGGR